MAVAWKDADNGRDLLGPLSTFSTGTGLGQEEKPNVEDTLRRYIMGDALELTPHLHRQENAPHSPLATEIHQIVSVASVLPQQQAPSDSACCQATPHPSPTATHRVARGEGERYRVLGPTPHPCQQENAQHAPLATDIHPIRSVAESRRRTSPLHHGCRSRADSTASPTGECETLSSSNGGPSNRLRCYVPFEPEVRDHPK